MASLLTNASAQTALRSLRDAQSSLQETQDRISTGLKVRSPAENPAFFLVAQTIRGDVAVLDGLKDNLTVGISASTTASSGLSGITADINQVQSALTTAQTGTALSEVQFAIDQVVESVEGRIDASSFNGINLLAGTDTTTITTTITREAGSFDLSTFTLQSQNLDSTEIAGRVGATPIFATDAEAQTAFDNLYRAFNSGLADRLDISGDGTVDLSPTGVDDQLTADGITRPANPFGGTPAEEYFTFYGSDDDIAFLNSIGIGASNLGNIGGDASQEVIAINLDSATGGGATQTTGGTLDATSAGTGGVAINYTAAAAAASGGATDVFTAGSGEAEFADVETYLQSVVFDDSQLRAFADATGFRSVARQIEVEDSSTANVQAGFVLADTLISRVNVAATVVGVFESTLESRQTFLSDLTDSLELGVAALTEADLNEESSTLQALQVQEQLAVQALSIANQRPQTILSLFR
ncbi:MAG: flagellin [Pseudomonadota bacterium]